MGAATRGGGVEVWARWCVGGAGVLAGLVGRARDQPPSAFHTLARPRLANAYRRAALLSVVRFGLVVVDSLLEAF